MSNYIVRYIETCGSTSKKALMTGAQLSELMGGLDYEVISYKEVDDETAKKIQEKINERTRA